MKYNSEKNNAYVKENIPNDRLNQFLAEHDKQIREKTIDEVIKNIEIGIEATGHTDSYTTGFCNALIWLKSCITSEEPQFFKTEQMSDANIATKCADDEFRNYVTKSELAKCEMRSKIEDLQRMLTEYIGNPTSRSPLILSSTDATLCCLGLELLKK